MAVEQVQDITPEQAAAELLGTEVPPAEEAAAAPAEGGETPAAEPVEEAAQEAKPETGNLSPLLKKLIDTKYGGDQEKFLAGIYEGWNSTSRLAEQLEGLQQKLLEQTQKAEEPPDPATLSPEIPRIEKRLQSIDVKLNTTIQKMNGLVGNANQINLEIAKLAGMREKADEYDRGKYEDQIQRLEDRKTSLREKYESLSDINEQLREEQTYLADQLGDIRKQVEGRWSQQQREKLEEAQAATAFKVQTVQDFMASIEEEASTYGVEAGSKRFDHMAGTIRAEITQYLRSLPEDAPAIDIKAFVKARAKEYADALGVSATRKVQQLSQQKLQATTKPPAPPALQARVAQAASKGSPEPKTAKEARAWAARVLEG